MPDPDPKPRILIVDDDPDIQGFLEAVLEDDYRVSMALTGEKGLEDARRQRPDLILLDIGLPGIDGYEVCQRLKSGGLLAETPVIMITVSDREEELERSFEAGAEDFIRKPISIVEVTNRIRNQLRMHRSEALVEHQALYDRLTDLPNRNLSFDRLEQAIRHDQQNAANTGVLCIDLDNFKAINDAFGYDAGDQLLLQAAARLRAQLRDEDTLGRLGADEFVAILPALARDDQAHEIADQIIEGFAEPFRISGLKKHLSVSIGVAVSPKNSDDAGKLLASSDAAMSQAKAEGKASVRRFDQSMSQTADRRLLVAHHLFDAIDRGQLEVYYQPKWDLRRQRISGAEALLRWTHSQLGPVGPEEFIKEAERGGMIWRIGEFVLRRGCEEFLEVCDSEGRLLSLAVNVSVQQIRRPEFADLVSAILDETGFAPQRLELEITENLLLNVGETISSNLNRLRKRGVKLAMDDFGTGYSSLSYLSTHPFDVVKIDRMFVKGMAHDRAHRDLVRAAVSMGHALNLEVVAEGVENRDELDVLAQMGCDSAQGYWLSRALPCDAFRKLLLGGSHRD